MAKFIYNTKTGTLTTADTSDGTGDDLVIVETMLPTFQVDVHKAVCEVGRYLDHYAAPSLDRLPPSRRFRAHWSSWCNGGRSNGTYLERLPSPGELLRRAPLKRRCHLRPWRWHYHRCRRDKW